MIASNGGPPAKTIEDLQSVLLAMERLLRRVGESRRADLLRQKRADLQTESREVLDWLASAAVWGSSGTLADLIICEANHHVSDDYDRNDRRFSDLLLRLVALLRAAGYREGGFDAYEPVLRYRLAARSSPQA